MKRSKKLPTRKRRALGHLALLAVLAALLSVLHLYNFLPSQAVYEAEEITHAGPTEIAATDWKAPDGSQYYYPQLLAVSEREDTVLFTVMQFHLWGGWNLRLSSAMDCAPGAPLWGDAWVSSTRNDQGRCYLFLRIGDPAITALDVDLRCWIEWNNSRKEWDRETAVTLHTTADDWEETKDGTRYYLTAVDGTFVNTRIDAVATGYDAHGSIVAEFDSYEP